MRRIIMLLTVAVMVALVSAVVAGPAMADVRFHDRHNGFRFHDNGFRFHDNGFFFGGFDRFDRNNVADFEIDQDIEETGAVDISTNVSQSGDNSNQCVAPLQFGNTGNLQNAQGFVQLGGFGGFDRDRHDRFFDFFDTNVDDVEFEGSTFEFTPELTNTCDQSVEQAAAAG